MKTTKPGSQRKRLFLAADHVRRKSFSAQLSPDLKRKHHANAFPVKTGDTVRVMRGDRRGFEGRITGVDRKKFRILIEGVTREKVDGTTIQIPIHPSKAMIVNLNLDDKWRREALKRRTGPLAEEIRSQETKTDAEIVGEEARKSPPPKESQRKPRSTQEAARKPQRTRRKSKKTQKGERPRQVKASKTRPEQGVE